MIAPRFASHLIAVVIFDSIIAYGQTDHLTPVPAANQTIGTGITEEINSGQDAPIADAERQIRVQFAKGAMPFTLWRTWLPALMNTRHYQEVADLSIEAAAARTSVETMVPVLEYRANALLALNKDKEALAAAKSYYNVCALKDTGAALDLICKCLKDKDQITRFRAEQAAASVAAANGTGNAPISSFLKSVHVDQQPYSKALEERARQRLTTNYANLLLAADRPAEAEAIFRELFQSTSNPNLGEYIEGIARSLRAEDGNVARADAWLLALQSGPSPLAAK